MRFPFTRGVSSVPQRVEPVSGLSRKTEFRMNLLGLVRPAALALLGAVPFILTAQSARPSPSVGEARQAITEWVELQTRIATARAAWAQEKDIAEHRIKLFEDELGQLKVTIAEALEAATTAEQRRGQLDTQAATIRASTAPFERRIAGYEARIRRLAPQLPPPLRQRLEPLYARLPEEARAAQTDLSNRLATVIGVFTEIEKFNRAITLATDTQTLPSGARAQVKVIYIGLAAAYAADETGAHGWIGKPTATGWVWEAEQAGAGDIFRTIGIYERRITPPAYVPLPARID